MAEAIKRLITAEDGQAMTEYSLILALVALVAVVAISQLYEPIAAMFSKVMSAFTGGSSTAGVQQLAPAGNWDYGPGVFKT